MNNMFVKNFEIIKHEFDPCEDYIHIERTHNKNEAKVFETKNKDITNELEDFCHFVKWQALEIILDHHERIDGTGYPKNKKGDEISTLAKIVSICDVYNALATDRVYRKAMCPQEDLMVLEEAKGTQLDCQLVNTFKNEVVPFI